MGERHGWLFEPAFSRSVKLRQADRRISDNAGALLLREIDHRLAFTADLAAELTDPRRPDRIRYQQVELLRQHLYGLALGHVHQDDHSRGPGRPTKDGDEFAIELRTYQAESWSRPYRLVLVVIDLPDPKTGLRKLFPHYFFLITNWPAERRGAWALLEHYRKRGTFEDRLGEFNACVGNGLSSAAFEANEAALLLKLLAFNLAGIVRGELENASGNGWDLKRVQRMVLKTGARVARHAGRLLVDISRAAGVLWGRVLARVSRWWHHASWGRDPAGRRRGPRPHRWVPPPSHAHLFLVLRE